jgi:RES domain
MPHAGPDPILCSECFTDEGLRLVAQNHGYVDQSVCKNCGATSGAKLDRERLEDLLADFFCNGTFLKTEFGGANLLAYNPMRYGEREVIFPDWLKNDAQLIEDTLKVGIFHYGPATWRLGEIEPLEKLRHRHTRKKAAEEIISHFPSRQLLPEMKFYRIRKNLKPGQEFDPLQFDAAPRRWRSNGRLDSPKISALYGSENLEICVHECRILIPDECFVATLRPRKEMKLLDLCAEIDEQGTPFESLNFAMRFLFAAESASYPMTQAIAAAAIKRGFDGIWYPSYFSLVKEDTIPNIAIFGTPIRAKKVQVVCTNRSSLKSAAYEIRMGPIFG